MLYAHRPDPATPLEEQIEEFNKQILQGHCETVSSTQPKRIMLLRYLFQWGVSNMQPETLQKILNICEAKGWQKPSCYQGNYNMVTRGMETKLLPILRANDISYNGFQYVF